MSAYAFVQTDIKDEAEFKKYAELASIALAKFGGEMLVRSSEMIIKEGTARSRTTLVRFPDMETAERCYDSPEYQAALKHIPAAADRDYRFVPGL